MRSHLLRTILLRILASGLVLLGVFVMIIASARGDESHIRTGERLVRGVANQPLALGRHVPGHVKGQDAFILLRHLPAGAKPNVGLDVGPGVWLLAADALDRLTLTLPHPGHVRLTAQLLDTQLVPASAEEPVRIIVTDPATAPQPGN